MINNCKKKDQRNLTYSGHKYIYRLIYIFIVVHVYRMILLAENLNAMIENIIIITRQVK
jgi:hypothetical protein